MDATRDLECRFALRVGVRWNAQRGILTQMSPKSMATTTLPGGPLENPLLLNDPARTAATSVTASCKEPHCTTSVSGKVCVAEPEVAVTVSVYVPAGVPFGFGCCPPELPLPMAPPPPQDASRKHKVKGTSHRYRRIDFIFIDGLRGRSPGTTTIPSMVMARLHDHDFDLGAETGGSRCTAAMVRDVVFMETPKDVGATASNGLLAGTEQVTPSGAPVQVRAAVPLIPPPPREIMYDAVCPALTVNDAGSPGVISSPMLEV